MSLREDGNLNKYKKFGRNMFRIGLLFITLFISINAVEKSIGFDAGIDLPWFQLKEFSKNFDSTGTRDGYREIHPGFTGAVLFTNRFNTFFELQNVIRYSRQIPNVFFKGELWYWDPQTFTIKLEDNSHKFNYGFEIHSLIIAVKPIFFKTIGKFEINCGVGTGVSIPLDLKAIATKDFMEDPADLNLNDYRNINIPILLSIGTSYQINSKINLFIEDEFYKNLITTRNGNGLENYTFPLKKDKLMGNRISVGTMYTLKKSN